MEAKLYYQVFEENICMVICFYMDDTVLHPFPVNFHVLLDVMLPTLGLGVAFFIASIGLGSSLS